jgi:hypothetical protein
MFPVEWSYVLCLKTVYVPVAFIVSWDSIMFSLSKFLANGTLKQSTIVHSSEEKGCQWILSSENGALTLCLGKYGIL